MRIAAPDALTLAAVLRRDLAAIRGLESHIAQMAAPGLSRLEVDSLGFALHNLYNALENSFTQTSLTFENHVKDQARWHRELLEKMFLDLTPLRPAVLPAPCRPLLADLLGFRHLFRHAYEMQLDPGKLAALRARWLSDGPRVLAALEDFLVLLDAASSGPDSTS